MASADFGRAVAFVNDKTMPDFNCGILERICLYALYKQATVGPCNTPAPSTRDILTNKKHRAWFSLGLMSKSEAQKCYVRRLTDFAPIWRRL